MKNLSSIRHAHSGFTLIELIVVIVILGILAATALPKFIDVSVDAADASAAGVAGAVTSGSTMNYSKSLVGTPTTALTSASACTALEPLLVGGVLPTNITWINGATTLGCAKGATSTTCQLKHAKGTAAGTNDTKVTAICTG